MSRGCSAKPERFGSLKAAGVRDMSAGIAFCFKTQLGRYAKIKKKTWSGYSAIQDAHFSPGGASGGTGRARIANPIETHVYLARSEGEDFARQCLDLGERTCFLHAF